MKPWLLFVLLLAKHFVAANLMDVGYSDARRRASRHFRRALARHLVAELIFTSAVFWSLAPISLILALAVEASVQIVMCILERRAPMAHILRTHVLCEAFLLVSYTCLVLILS